MLENLSNRLFWDVDPNKLDWEKDMPLIITRVFERGTLEEVQTTIKKYGIGRIAAIAKTIRSMDIMAANFIATLSETPLTEFECYSNRQLSKLHWIY